MTFFEVLDQQRWDDHRYYHHSRINQTLHFFSAISFMCAYALLWVEPALAVFIAWVVAMPARQIGHFFFEPRGYDEVNLATHEHKERIKVGYNLRRKVVLMAAWAFSPLLLIVSPACFGWLDAPVDWRGWADNVAVVWLWIAAGALVGRTAQLCVIDSVQTGLVWCTKILTDPFHDVKLYHGAPARLLRGELLDPMVPSAQA